MEDKRKETQLSIDLDVLMERFSDGDDDAFDEILPLTREMVYNTSYRIIGNVQDAEEATQDTYVKLHRSIGAFKSGSRAVPWLVTIACNSAKDRLRRIRCQPKFTQASKKHEVDEIGLDSFIDTKASTAAQDDSLATAVRDSMIGLCSTNRDIMELKYFEGMTNKELSNKLGIGLSTVKMRLSYTKGVMRSRLVSINNVLGNS